jgi:hypothetical protein
VALFTHAETRPALADSESDIEEALKERMHNKRKHQQAQRHKKKRRGVAIRK